MFPRPLHGPHTCHTRTHYTTLIISCWPPSANNSFHLNRQIFVHEFASKKLLPAQLFILANLFDPLPAVIRRRVCGRRVRVSSPPPPGLL